MDKDNSYDAILIGAGPAGSSAAAILAEHGHNVLLIEREKFPRYHVGESLIPFTFEPLKRLGLSNGCVIQHSQKSTAYSLSPLPEKLRNHFILIPVTTMMSHKLGRF